MPRKKQTARHSSGGLSKKKPPAKDVDNEKQIALDECQRIIDELFADDEAYTAQFFNLDDPTRPDLIPYRLNCDSVAQMDLRIIETKLALNKYKKQLDFHYDMNRMFKNCKEHLALNDGYMFMLEALESSFKKKWDAVFDENSNLIINLKRTKDYEDEYQSDEELFTPILVKTSKKAKVTSVSSSVDNENDPPGLVNDGEVAGPSSRMTGNQSQQQESSSSSSLPQTLIRKPQLAKRSIPFPNKNTNKPAVPAKVIKTESFPDRIVENGDNLDTSREYSTTETSPESTSEIKIEREATMRNGEAVFIAPLPDTSDDEEDDHQNQNNHVDSSQIKRECDTSHTPAKSKIHRKKKVKVELISDGDDSDEKQDGPPENGDSDSTQPNIGGNSNHSSSSSNMQPQSNSNNEEYGAKPMSYEEKAKLLSEIYQLQLVDKVKIKEIVEIIQEREISLLVDNWDEFDIDLEILRPSTLRELEVFVAANLTKKLPRLSLSKTRIQPG